jgi:hypothetical protein
MKFKINPKVSHAIFFVAIVVVLIFLFTLTAGETKVIISDNDGTIIFEGTMDDVEVVQEGSESSALAGQAGRGVIGSKLSCKTSRCARALPNARRIIVQR